MALIFTEDLLDLSDEDFDDYDNYCDTNCGLFWGEVTEEEIRFMADLKNRVIAPEDSQMNTTFTVDSPQEMSSLNEDLDLVSDLISKKSLSVISEVTTNSSLEVNCSDHSFNLLAIDETNLMDISVEVNAKDLLSPFYNKEKRSKLSDRLSGRPSNRFSGRLSDQVSGNVPVTCSLIAFDNTPAGSERKSTPHPSKIKPRLSSLPSRCETRRKTRLSTIKDFDQTPNDSTLEFILNEIKCNVSDNSEDFL